VMVYGGAGDAWEAFGSVRDLDSVLVPGRVYEMDVPLAPPAGGLPVPAGARLGLMVVPVMHQNDAADLEVLVGGATGSRAAWTEAPLAPGSASWTRGSAAGEVVGSAYAGDAAPESTSRTTRVAVPPRAGGLLAWMNVTAHEGIPDVDLQVVAPDGTVVAASGTPTPREMVRLSAENLDPAGGEYALVVTSYGSARASYSLEWAIGTS
ncbi:MAG TPA: hypothetical protein VHH36_02550, partial [Candidatus Thermoplasmatota archaeon]|nr:hypothetical protein [Candidatus Thermoplasmatota archaeon]